MTNAIDDLFDTATPATVDNQDQTNESANVSTSDTTTETVDASTEFTYPNVHATYRSTDVPADENPPGTMTVPEFAGHLTVQNVLTANAEGKVPDHTAVVQGQTVYQAIKAVRAPLPVVLVFQVADDGTVDESHKNAKYYIPVDAGVEAWKNRPARGSGPSSTGSVSVRSDDKLMLDGAKNKAEWDKAKDRLAKLQERVNKLEERHNKYVKYFENRNLSWENADKAYTEWLSEQDAAKEISDDEKTPSA